MSVAPGRVGSPDEIQFVRDQARVWKVLNGMGLRDKQRVWKGVLYTLDPACFWCASDRLDHDPANMVYLCRVCGKTSDSLDLRAGRIIRR